MLKNALTTNLPISQKKKWFFSLEKNKNNGVFCHLGLYHKQPPKTACENSPTLFPSTNPGPPEAEAVKKNRLTFTDSGQLGQTLAKVLPSRIFWRRFWDNFLGGKTNFMKWEKLAFFFVCLLYCLNVFVYCFGWWLMVVCWLLVVFGIGMRRFVGEISTRRLGEN